MLDLGVRLAAIQGTLAPAFPRKAVVVMAGDHGVVEQGVSAFPSEVTAQMVANFARGQAAINALAGVAGARVVVVDVGVAADLSPLVAAGPGRRPQGAAGYRRPQRGAGDDPGGGRDGHRGRHRRR